MKVLSSYFKNRFLEMQYNLHQIKMQTDEFSQSEHTCVTGIPNNKQNLKSYRHWRGTPIPSPLVTTMLISNIIHLACLQTSHKGSHIVCILLCLLLSVNVMVLRFVYNAMSSILSYECTAIYLFNSWWKSGLFPV